MREAGAAAARQRPERAWPAGRAAEPPGTNELRAGKSRPGKMEGSSEGSGAAREEPEGKEKRGEKGRRGGAEERGGAKLVGAGSCAAFAEG